jgi:Spy/CpxP family protein refolding chaperone
VIVAASAAVAVPALAHRAGPGPDARHEMRGGGMGMLRGLDLTEAQRDQIFKLRHEQAPAARERMKAARAAQDALRQAARDPNADSARIRQLADAVGKAHADAAVARVDSERRILAVLTPEQRAKLEQARERRSGRR